MSIDVAETEIQQTLNVLLIDEDVERANALICALGKSRYRIEHIEVNTASLLKLVDAKRPDVIVIDIESPSRDVLESLHTLSRYSPKPVVMFSDENDTEIINQSVKSGVSAYVVGNVDPGRVKPILDAAVARFAEFNRLKNELVETRQQLNGREMIDKAKRALIKKKSMTEEQAFQSMRKMAMDSGQKMEDVAKTVLSILNNLESGAETRW